MGRFTSKPFSVNAIAQELYSDFDALKAERENTDREILKGSKNLTSQWLS